jgi:hypothetical protein
LAAEDEAGGADDSRGSRGFSRSWALIAGAFAAIVVEVLILFGLGPLRIWVPVAVGVLLGGVVLAVVDSRAHDNSTFTRVNAIASLVVALLSLILAAVTIFNGFPALG